MGTNAEGLFLEWLLKQRGLNISSQETKGERRGKHIWIFFEGKVVGVLDVFEKGRRLCFNFIAEEKDAGPIKEILAFTRYLREVKKLHVSSCSTSRAWERDIQAKRALGVPA